MLRKTFGLSLAILLTTAALPSEVEAQRRSVIRRAPVRRVIYVSRPYYPAFHYPFYSGWYGAAWYGWPGWYHPFGFYPQYYPYPYGYRYDYAGAARIEVTPREAEVYVDGYLVGTVDDFDGWLQRLRVAPGEHEVQVYLPGHRTLTEKVLFRPGATVHIKGALEPLAAGTPDEPRPTPGANPAPAPRRGYPPPGPPPRDYPREEPRPDGERVGPPQPLEAEHFGTLTISVQPADAEILIDGDRWDAPKPGEHLAIQLAEGSHRVEIRRAGFRTYSTTVAIRSGQTVPLNVSLPRS